MTDHADTIRRAMSDDEHLIRSALSWGTVSDVGQDVRDRATVALDALLSELQQAREAHAELGKRLADGLAAMYPTYPEAVAELCDMWLDKSGRLLGEVRSLSLGEQP